MDAVNKILSREIAATTAIAMDENVNNNALNKVQNEMDSNKNRTYCG